MNVEVSNPSCTGLRSRHIYIVYIFPIGGNIVLDFTEAVYDVDEDNIDVDICMQLSGLPAGGLECDLVVPLNLVDGKAGESLNSHT